MSDFTGSVPPDSGPIENKKFPRRTVSIPVAGTTAPGTTGGAAGSGGVAASPEVN